MIRNQPDQLRKHYSSACSDGRILCDKFRDNMMLSYDVSKFQSVLGWYIKVIVQSVHPSIRKSRKGISCGGNARRTRSWGCSAGMN
jgi:hypothetical protein